MKPGNNEQKGVDAEVVALIAQHQSRLRGLLRCMIAGHADVDDLLQEVNVVICQKADTFEIGTDFWAWASQIARYKVMERGRTFARSRLVFDDSFLDELAEVATQRASGFDEQRDALRRCLQNLPPAQRALIEMRYASERTIGSIASEMDRPAGSIRQTLYRIRGLLIQCIQNRLGDLA
ncbi:RNA polymerase sigma factor RpoE [Rubripirellula lacrimiformis]|uniref:RNA polymerase sigma factor RpoE n=1 Tax=Rubripirellula lacrimiformis TaxID=1930273 RepID=A0A517NE18_9BACT|nr:sigma-70 family RNA polymerase sigma factor [Rubripirellula lacrimiformis]QDT05376.1 RNA polymerase sigma factor RpoE [Rubripirellula lacrimiformis]